MKFIADDFHVRPFLRHHRLTGLGNRLTKGVVLIDDVNFFDGLDLRNSIRESSHFHVGIGVETEMPKTAFVVGECGIDCAGVHEQHGFVGVSLIVFVYRFNQRCCDIGAVGLIDIANALVDGLFQGELRFLRIAFAIQRDDLKLATKHAATGVDFIGGHLHMPHHRLADVREGAGQRIDHRDLDRIGGVHSNGCDQRTQSKGNSAKLHG